AAADSTCPPWRRSAGRWPGGRAGTMTSPPRVALGDEAVHLAAVDIGDGVGRAVRAAAIAVGAVMVGTHAVAARARHAHRRAAVLHRDAVSTGKGPEVVVEGPV